MRGRAVQAGRGHACTSFTVHDKLVHAWPRRGGGVQAGESRKELPYSEPPTNTDSSVFSRILKLITDDKGVVVR